MDVFCISWEAETEAVRIDSQIGLSNGVVVCQYVLFFYEATGKGLFPNAYTKVGINTSEYCLGFLIGPARGR